MLYKPLVPLRIPAGWEVRFNNFVELGPLEKLSAEEQDAWLSQDLLSIAARQPHKAYIVDVGWRPDGDPAGCYILTVVEHDWDHVLLEFQSHQTDTVRQAIETCLERLNAGDDPADIQAVLVAAKAAGSSKITKHG